MRKVALFIILGFFILGCRLSVPFRNNDQTGDDETLRDNVCYSEANLTDEECNNLGTHEYSSSIEVRGIGGTECAMDDGSTVLTGYNTYTFTFLDGDAVEYSHPEEMVWDEYTHILSKTGKNTYLYTGMVEDMNTSWEVQFKPWGFQEELRLTWACENGTCGCVTTGDFDIYD